MTRVFVTKDVHCPFSAAVELIEEFHERSKTLRFTPFGRMEAAIACNASEIRDVTDQTRIHEALAIRWEPQGVIRFPTVYGLITVRPNGVATEIRVEATYQPPLGPIGAACDAVVGRRAVRSMLEEFLNDVYAFIEQRYGLERMLHPSCHAEPVEV